MIQKVHEDEIFKIQTSKTTLSVLKKKSNNFYKFVGLSFFIKYYYLKHLFKVIHN